MAGYKNTNKFYDVDGIGNSDFTGRKFVTGKFAREVDGSKKSSFYIGRITDAFGNAKPLHKVPMTNYKAYLQFCEIVENNPQALKKGKYKLNADGTLSKALLQALGTNAIAELDGVSTISALEKEMKSW